MKQPMYMGRYPFAKELGKSSEHFMRLAKDRAIFLSVTFVIACGLAYAGAFLFHNWSVGVSIVLIVTIGGIWMDIALHKAK
jgi:uncharacterized RDD family membrane protein YckC